MKLVSSAASPFVRKVRVVLIETGQTDDVEIVPVKTTPMATDAQVAAANPIGKIPALIRDDGPAIYDSRVICRYLNDRAGASLYPGTRIWDVLTLEATGDGMSDAAVLMVYEVRSRPEEKRHAPWVDGQWAKIERAMSALEDRWMGLLEGPLNIGQIAVGCALGYLDFRHADRDWRAGHPGLAAWAAEFGKRPAMHDTEPKA